MAVGIALVDARDRGTLNSGKQREVPAIPEKSACDDVT
jgi:hypothetical protein